MNETSQLPLRLTRRPSPWVVVLMRLAFAILWNGFFGVFVVLAWPHLAETPILIQVVLGLFLLLGVGIVWDVVVRFYRTLTGKTAVVEVDRQPLHPGDTVRIRVCQRGLNSLRRLHVGIAASNTVTKQSGTMTTTTTKPCYQREIAVWDPAATAADSYDETFAVQIPSESFRGTVEWSIVVRQDLAQGGIDFQTFPLRVVASAAQRRLG